MNSSGQLLEVQKLILKLILFGLGTFFPLMAQEVWTDGGLGTTDVPFNYNATNDTFTIVNTSGSGFGGTADGGHYVYETVQGNTEIIGQVNSLAASGSPTSAGLMLRNSLATNAVRAYIGINPGSGIVFSVRPEAGQNSIQTTTGVQTSVPIWLRLTCNATQISGYFSVDGTNWSLVGTQAMQLASSYLTGMAVSNGTAVFGNLNALTNVPQPSPSLAAWYRADVGVTQSGGTVSGWADQSGNEVDLYPGTAASPTYVTGVSGYNSNPVVRFNGTTQSLLSAKALYSNNITIFAVYDLQGLNTTNAQGIITQSYGTTIAAPTFAWGLGGASAANGTQPQAYGDVNGTLKYAATAITTTLKTPYVLEGKYDGSNLTSYLNGLLKGSTLASGQIYYGNATSFNVGQDVNGEFLNGDVAEILVFNTAISEQQRQQVEAYLFQKYGVGTEPTAPNPIASVGTGIYPSGQAVTLTPGYSGDTIYYSLNGEPYQVYSSPLTLTSTTTLAYYESSYGFLNSAPVTQTYTIDPGTGEFLPMPTSTRPQLWYRADVGVTQSSGVVSQWLDQSGHGVIMVPTTGTSQPSYQTGVSGYNGNPVVRFNGAQSLVSQGSYNLGGGTVTMFAVYDVQATSAKAQSLITQSYSPTGWAAPYVVWGLGGAAAANAYQPRVYVNVNGTYEGAATTTKTTLTTPYVLEGKYDGSKLTSYINGLLNGTVLASGTIKNGTTTTFNIGTDSNGELFHGDVAEILVFNTAISEQQRQQVESYLFQKYGVGTQPTAPNPTASTGNGIYSSPQTVTLTPGYTGDTIYYSLNGGAYQAYSSALNIATTTTLTYYESANGFLNSSPVTQTYTIDPGTGEFLPMPTSIRPQLWYRADVGVTQNGGVVSKWLDQSGNGVNMVPTTGTSQPSYQTMVSGYNGNPVVRFNGAQSLVSQASYNLGGGTITMFAVYDVQATSAKAQSLITQSYAPTGWVAPYVVWGLGGAAAANAYQPRVYVNVNGTYEGAATTTKTTLTTPYVLEGKYDGSKLTSYINGLLNGTVLASGTIKNGTTTTFNIGTDSNGELLHGDVAEILVFNSAISEQQRQQVESYLFQKYGVGAQPTAPNPIASVGTGIYPSGQAVTLTPGYSGDTIYYSVDGGTTYQVYTASLTLTSTTTVQYYESATGFLNSSPVTQTYTIDPGTGEFLSLPTSTRPQLWYRADVGVAQSGGVVSKWLDQSGQGVNLVPTTGTSQPSYQTGVSGYNGNPVVRFSGTQSLVSQGSYNLGAGTITMFAVYDLQGLNTTKDQSIITQSYAPTGWAAPYVVWGLGGASAVKGMQPQAYVNVSGTYKFAPTTTTTTLTTPYVLEGKYDGSKLTSYVNGLLNGTTLASGSIKNGTTTTFNIGTDGNGELLHGDVAEILVFNTAITEQQRQQVEAYLFQKYGVGTQPTAPNPNVSAGTGIYSSPQTVTLTPGYTGDTIYYSLNGGAYQVYSSPLNIATTTTLAYYETANGFINSPTFTQTYTFDSNATFLQGSRPQLWLRADMGITQSGGIVSSWADQSGSGLSMTPTTGSSQPTYLTGVNGYNNNPVIRFNGSTQSLMGSSTALQTNNITIFAVYDLQGTNTTKAQSIITQSYGATYKAPYFSWGLNGALANSTQPYSQVGVGTTSYTAPTGVTTTLATPYVLEGVYNGSKLTSYLNGSLEGTTNVSGAINYSGTTFNLGTDVNGEFLNGDVAEVLIFTSTLSDSQRLQVENYLAQKYALPPTLSIITGNNQVGDNGIILPQPMTIQLNNAMGAPLANTPVTFTISSGGGGLTVKGSGTPSSSPITLNTNSLGQAAVYYSIPATPSGAHTIAVTAGTAVPITFTQSNTAAITALPSAGNNSQGGASAPPGAYGVTPIAGPVPFNAYTGNTSRIVDDLLTPAVGEIGLDWKRYLHTRLTDGSKLFDNAGVWRHSFQWDLGLVTVNGQQEIEIVYPDGGTNYFALDTTSNVYRSTFAIDDVVVKVSASSYKLIRSNNQVYNFSSTTVNGATRYFLASIMDSKGNQTLLSWGNPVIAGQTQTTTWTLNKVTEPGGRNLTIAYGLYPIAQSNGSPTSYGVFMTKVTTSDGRSVIYSYSAWSTATTIYQWLSKAAYSDGTAATYQFGRMNPGNNDTGPTTNELTQALDVRAEGVQRINYAYYDTFLGYKCAPGIIVVIYNDLDNYNYYAANNITLTPNQAIVSYLNNTFATINTYTAYTYNVDSQGDVVSMVDSDPANNVNVTTNYSYNYNATNKTVTITTTDANGHATSEVKTLSGQLLSRTYPITGTETVAPTESSTYTTDANNYTYLQQYQDARGNLTKFFYAANPNAGAPQLLSSIQYADGTTESYTYNSTLEAKHIYVLATHTRRNGGVENFTYDTAGHLLTKQEAAQAPGQVTTYAYDTTGRVHSITDANGTVGTFTYNDRGLVTQTTAIDPANNNPYKKYTYDNYGHLMTVTDELTHATNYTYDYLNRLLTTQDALGNTTTYTYDQNAPGNNSPVQIVSPTGKQTLITYAMLAGYKPVQVTNEGVNGVNPSTSYTTYDLVGNVVSSQDPNGRVSTATYDARNRKTSATDPLGNTVNYTYDDNNNVLTTVSPVSTTTNTYDSLNRVLTSTVTSTDPKNLVSTYTYDAEGKVLTYTDPNLKVYTYEYDLEERLLSMIYPDDTEEMYDYDAVGNLHSYTTRDERVQTFSYDNRNRNTGYVWNDGVTPSVSKTFDVASRLYTLSNVNSTLTYTYDNANRLLSEQQAITGLSTAQTVGYAYNTDNTAHTLTYPDGTVLTYGYDGRNNLTSIQQSGLSTDVVDYSYDYNNNRTGKTLGNGIVSTIGYDTDERLSTIVDAKGATTVQSFAYGYDAVSRAKYVKRANGLGDVYGYDTSDQLTQVQYGATNPDTTNPINPARTVGYSFDCNGNRTQVVDSINGTTTYMANADNQYTAVGGQSPSYDDRGNLSSYNGTSYTYDAEGHLTQAVAGSTTKTYYYDPLGRCVATYDTSSSTTTYSIYDTVWNTLEEFAATGSQPFQGTSVETQRYVNGSLIDEILSKTNLRSVTTAYYHFDGTGSVTGLTDGNGNLVEQYSYDIYGTPTITDGLGNPLTATQYGNRFLFTGREYDAAIGIYHYRFRDYSPSLGRFLQPDPIGHGGDAYNIYRYCGNDPVNHSDPIGLDNNDDQFSISTGSNFGYGNNNQGEGFSSGFTITSGLSGVTFNGFNLGYSGSIGSSVQAPIQSTLGTSYSLSQPHITDSSKFGSNNDHVLRFVYSTSGPAPTGNDLTYNPFQMLVINYFLAPLLQDIANSGQAGKEGSDARAGLALLFTLNPEEREATGTIFDWIKATQPLYKGTLIPRSFVLSTENGSIWVHGNATEHIYEYANALLNKGVNPELVNLNVQQQLRSLRAAVNTAISNGVPYNQLITVGGWELKFAAPRAAGELPALIHALPK